MQGVNESNRELRVLRNVFIVIGSIFALVGLIIGIILFTTKGSRIFSQEEFIISTVFITLGVIFCITGFICGIVLKARNAKVKRLKNNGISYDAQIVNISRNYFTSVNNISPLIFECVYQDEKGIKYLVKSQNIWIDPLLTNLNDIKAKVWVNPSNEKDYIVDVVLDGENKPLFDKDLR